jgi:hypothetical protein
VPWLLSGVLHVAVLAWWASLPEPPRRVAEVEPDLRPIELVELVELVELPPASPPEPTPEPVPVQEPALDEPHEPSPTAPTEASRRPKGPTAPHESAPSPGAVGPADPSESPSQGAVALLGLRDGSRAASQGGSLRPELPPPAVGHGRMSGRVGAHRPSSSALADGSPRSLEEAGFEARRNGTRVFRDPTGRFTATLGADGRVKFRDMPVAVRRDPMTGAPQGLAMPGLAEGLRVASGQELYNEDKKRLLEQTFELRLRLAIAFAQDKIDRRLGALYRELLEAWKDTTHSEAERRALLFRRWDDCEEGLAISLPGFAEAHSSVLDDLRRSAGASARETIERFVRRQLPAGSPQAYTDDELRRLNASRRSRARFDPY